MLIRHIFFYLLSINTAGIRAHETVTGTKNAGADKKNQKQGWYYVGRFLVRDSSVV
jgi:hypothetical protein